MAKTAVEELKGVAKAAQTLAGSASVSQAASKLSDDAATSAKAAQHAAEVCIQSLDRGPAGRA